MGLLWWRKSKKEDKKQQQQQQQGEAKAVEGMSGAVEVPRRRAAEDVTVFEFGSVAATQDKVTLAGFCPVSDDLLPCRWEILPATDSEDPQFRIVF